MAVCAASPASAAPPKTLSSADATHYQAAFAAVRAGEFKTAAATLKKIEDRSLVGYVEYERLMHRSRKASYAELSAWLDQYGDLPGAERVYSLAERRRASQDALLNAPSVVALFRVVAEQGLALVGAPNPTALNAFYSGDAETAYKLAANSSERWVAGLSAFRLGRFGDARRHFDEVASDGGEDEWLRAGAAYWAARAVIADGAPEAALEYLTAAAQKPWTFYGMLAEAQLGLEPTIRFDGAPYLAPILAPPVDPIGSLLIKASTRQPVRPAQPEASDDEVARLVASDVRAHRAAALMQLGRLSDATQEITLGLAESKDAEDQRTWAALGHELSVPPAPKTPALGGFDPADYPLPPLAPKDGFTVDPALVYAIVRQESRFNPEAVSPVGAVGLMQLMPQTAVQTSGDDKLARKPKALQEPGLNLRLGQDYFTWLLQRGVGDDILAAVAAYNAGPGNLLKTQQQLGEDTDALMLIESLPSQETRAYVEKVMAGYWLYRRQFGAATASLEALAGGARRISSTLEQAVQIPVPAPVIEQAAVKF